MAPVDSASPPGLGDDRRDEACKAPGQGAVGRSVAQQVEPARDVAHDGGVRGLR